MMLNFTGDGVPADDRGGFFFSRYLVLEYVDGGELFEHILAAQGLQEWEAIRFFRQLLSGLTYCHAFSICHRDLKLENILLDSNKNLKIADFGFAALQPHNRLLETPCGSPHYVAPEILKAKPYRGDVADIWSCGVILYVLLLGSLPWDDKDLKVLLQKVTDGHLYVPNHLNPEAIDLLYRILEVDPRRRITIEEIWHHPLIKRYDAVADVHGTLEWFACPPSFPTVMELRRPATTTEIDHEVLRNLQALWHRESKDEIVGRLLDAEANQEKFFYRLLLKYREDHLEDYQGPDLEHSASDYHHLRRPLPRKLPSSRYSLARGPISSRQSQFSIVSSRSRRRDGYYASPQTAQSLQSYDPFRPSLNPLPAVDAPYANITVHRDQTAQPEHRPISLRHPAIARLGATGGSFASSSLANSTRTSGAASHVHSGVSRYASRSTFASTGYRSSPPVVVRASSSSRIRVAFNHGRSPSNNSQAGQRRDGARSRIEERRDPIQTPTASLPTLNFSSPTGPEIHAAPPPPRSRKEATGQVRHAPTAFKHSAQASIFREEARKVSNELKKVCDEAFKSSVFSSDGTSTTDPLREVDSPITSAATSDGATPPAGPTAGIQLRPMTRGKQCAPSRERALPPPPAAIEDAATIAHLRETRDKLLKRSTEGGPTRPFGYLDDVVAHLDRLLEPEPVGHEGGENEERRRTVSAGTAYRDTHATGGLPVISEEGRSQERDGASNDASRGRSGDRAASAPYPPRSAAPGPSRHSEQTSTIRLVPPIDLPPMAHVAPLNVRKRSEQSPAGGHVASTSRLAAEPGRYSARPQEDELVQRHSGRLPSNRDQPDDVIYEDDEDEAAEQPQGKRVGWFKRNFTSSGKENRRQGSENKKNAASDNKKNKASDEKRASAEETASWLKAPVGAKTEEEEQTRKLSGKKSFLKLFGRREPNKETAELTLGAPDGDDSVSFSSAGPASKADAQSSSTAGQRRPVQPQQHWLARFFHIKPASTTLCFESNKVRMRREIATLLRSWKKYGLRDVTVDKRHSIVFGRVDADNFLKIRPVSFACEVFAVLDHGRRAQLSVARFTQEKGAASSFYRVVSTVEDTLRHRGLLVADSKKRRAMTQVLQQQG